MIIRALSSAAAGITITTGLFFVMQFLIATGEEVLVEPRKRHVVAWINPPNRPDPVIVPPAPRKIDKPPVPPQTEIIESTDNGGSGIGVPVAPTAPRPSTGTIADFGLGDGPLINIIKVQPQYPAAAVRKNLEGTVTVRFDVTAMGLVENVSVVTSTNRIFNKAAVDAAYRFKYKPRVVDGTQYGAKGLQQQFRFKLEE